LIQDRWGRFMKLEAEFQLSNMRLQVYCESFAVSFAQSLS